MVLFSYLPFAFEALWLHVMRKHRFYAVLAALVFIIIPAFVFFVPASGFKSGTLITVEKEASFGETAAMLENQHIVASATLLKILARISGVDTSVQAGRYLFATPVGIGPVLYRLATGDSGIEAIRITFPEGITVREMADILAAALPGFDTEAFIEDGTRYEGYLFPDTYSFYADTTASEVITRMRERFNEVWESIDSENVGKDARVIMASILEKETKPGEDRQIVSGILWKRIDIGMALQVDAVFGYIKGVDTYHPSGKDLEIDSPYNTYLHRDLPPGPIGNPGKDALYAALHPTASPYLYYLSGSDGAVHYAKDFEGHKKNKELYLR